MRTLACLLVAALLVGALYVRSASSGPTIAPSEVEVRLAALAAGSTGGLNHTEGRANVTGALLQTRTDMLFLNSTNATAAWFVRLEVASVSGVSNLVLLDIGIDNGTHNASQILASAGALTQSTGAHVRIEPASANRIYLTQTVAVLGLVSVFEARLVASDETSEAASVTTDVILRVV